MKISKNSKDAIEKIHLFSGEKRESIKNIFEALLIIMSIDVYNKEYTALPLIGSMKLKHNGSSILDGEKRASISIDKYIFDDFFLKSISDLADGDESSLRRMIRSKIRETLGDYLL